MSYVCVVLANGFEEVEALTIVDLLRRANIRVDIASISGELKVNGAHGICVMADSIFKEGTYPDCDMLFLPGGMPGTRNLAENEELADEIRRFSKGNKRLAAICAAPSVYGEMGLLEGKNATCYPGFESSLKGANIVEEKVVTDGLITTSRGPGTAIDMALEIIRILEGKEKSDEIAEDIVFR